MTVRLDSRVFIRIFKMIDIDKIPGTALEQVRKKGYADKYREPHCEIFLIGVEFDRNERNIVRFEWEKNQFFAQGGNMKHPPTAGLNGVRPFFSRNRACLLFLSILITLLILALPIAVMASHDENPASSGNSMVGKNDMSTGVPIITGSGSVDYTLPLLDLSGPMEIKLSGDWHTGAEGQLQTAPFTLGTGGGQ